MREVELIPTEPLHSIEQFRKKIFNITQKRYLGVDDLPARAYIAVKDPHSQWVIGVLPAQELMDKHGKNGFAYLLRSTVTNVPPQVGTVQYYGIAFEAWLIVKQVPEGENVQDHVKKLQDSGTMPVPSEDPERVERMFMVVESKTETIGASYSIDRSDFNKLYLDKEHGAPITFAGRFANILYQGE